MFRDQAAAVHELIAYSYSRGLGISEETLTDVVLVELDRRLRPHVLTRKFTKHEESSVSGADWLWAIGRPGRWLTLLVQAKLARPNVARIAGLHHGKGNQRKTLIAYARQANCVPLYVVYSAFDGEPAAPVKPAKGRRKGSAPAWHPTCPMAVEDIKQMGCVSVRPRHVALMDRSKSHREDAVKLLSAGKPWSCLFCCPRVGAVSELADAVAAGIAVLPIDSPHARSPGGSETSEPDDLYKPAETLISEHAPQIVEDLLAGREYDGEPPCSAVAVISAEPLKLARAGHQS